MVGWILSACGLACLGLAAALVRLRRQLWVSREALAVLSEQAPIGILRADADGTCIYANGNWCELSGLSLKETLGHRWSQAIHPDDVAQVMARWGESVAAGQPYVNEVRMLRPDGTVRTVLAGGGPIRDDHGAVTGFIGTVLDITGLERANRELARREKLLRNLIDVQEEEKQLLCHEFHDGLMQYAVGSKMLLEGLREQGAVDPCRVVVDSVIDCLAKGIEDGRRVIRGIRPAALDDLGLRAALEDLAGELREAGIVVEATIDPDVDRIPPTLQTTVYRIVQESLNNARKHAGSDRIRVEAVRRGHRVEVSAQDFGCGFDQAAATGEGFGLLGIRERVRLAGGDCTVDSTPGRGTRVRAWLPLAVDDGTADAP
ncbi:MAG: PAS domain-containing protein [Planctomycetota bacterium]